MTLINFLSATNGGSITYLNNIVPRLLNLDKNNNFLFLITQLNYDKLKVLQEDDKRKFIIVDNKFSGYRRFFFEKSITKLIKQKGIIKVFNPYQIGRCYNNVENIFMIRNMEPFFYKKYKYQFKNFCRNFILNFLSKKTLKRADKIIAVSNYTENYLLDVLKIQKEKITTIYHGRDTSFSNNTSNPKDLKVLESLNLESENFLFTAGSFLPYRRLEDIILALSKIKNTHTIKLVISGDGNDVHYKNKILNLIHNLRLDEDIVNTGYISKIEIQSLYRHSLIFLTATEIEACPNIAIESLSSGCAVISSDVTPLKEIYKDAAIYFKERDVDMLANRVQKLVVDKKTRDDLSLKALKNASNFSWDICSEKTYELLTS